MSRLYKKFKEEVVPDLKKKYPDRGVMELPKLKKIVISMGLAKSLKDKNALQDHTDELRQISGQQPVATRSKKAISNFKLREGQTVGLMVTLRGKRMYDFLDRFCHIVSPRIHDFRGFPRKGDRRGSYSFGIVDQQVFPEIDLDKVKRTQGMNVTIVTTARDDEDCIELLSQLGFPYK